MSIMTAQQERTPDLRDLLTWTARAVAYAEEVRQARGRWQAAPQATWSVLARELRAAGFAIDHADAPLARAAKCAYLAVMDQPPLSALPVALLETFTADVDYPQGSQVHVHKEEDERHVVSPHA